MKIKLLLALCFIGFGAQAQNVVLNNGLKQWLISTTGVDSNGNTVNIDANDDNEIQYSEAEAIWELNVQSWYSQILVSSLQGIEAFSNLRKLRVYAIYSVTDVDFTSFTHLEELTCQGLNSLHNVDVSGLTNLHKLSIIQNSHLENINYSGTANIEELIIEGNHLPGTFELNNLTNLHSLSFRLNTTSGLIFNNTKNVKTINCSQNNLVNLDLSGQVQLQQLDCSDNHLLFLTIDSQTVTKINCSGNYFNVLAVPNLAALKELHIANAVPVQLTLGNLPVLEILDTKYANFTNTDFSGFTALKNFNCIYSGLTSLTLNNPLLQTLNCGHSTSLTAVDISQCAAITQVSAGECNNLSYVNLKNGSNTLLYLNYYPDTNLQICLDEGELEYLSQNVWNGGIPSYFNFDTLCLGGIISEGTATTIKGNLKFDITGNGCDEDDIEVPSVDITINNSIVNSIFEASTPNYNFVVVGDTYTITPNVGPWYIATPTSANITISDLSQEYVQDFCITPNGIHPDLDITIVNYPLNSDSAYDKAFKVNYNNKGNQTMSGTLAITFDENILAFAGTGQPGFTVSGGLIEASYTDLHPFSERELILYFFALDQQPTTTLEATIYPITGDETTTDNSTSVNFTLSALNPNKQLPVTLYPNPAIDIVTLTASNTTLEQVTLFDMQGRQLQTATPHTETYTIDVSGRAQGMYLIKIVTPKGAGIKKIIKN
jgi:hypothetical protein